MSLKLIKSGLTKYQKCTNIIKILNIKLIQKSILGFALIIFLWFTIDILNQTGWLWGEHIDFQKGSNYGTLVGGIFSFLTVILIFLTLRHQTQSYENSAFENRFFQLINYHRKNIEMWEYKNPDSKNGEIINGQRVFIYIHREVGKAIKYLKNDLKINKLEDILSDDAIKSLNDNKIISSRRIKTIELETINLAYLIVFFGLSHESRPVLERILTQRCDKDKVDRLLDFFQKIPAEWDKNGNSDKEYQNRINKNDHYKFFGGHQHRLGHYYRHVFQTVNYCNDFKPFIGDFKLKYGYLKTFRAQFSTYEQAVFTYNSLSVIGRVWELDSKEEGIDKQLITKYNLIKNIPAEFISEINLIDFYPNVEYEGCKITEEKEILEKKYK